MFMQDPYRDIVAVGGEPCAVTLGDESAQIQGMYDRRIFAGDIGGAEVRDANFVVGVVSSDLPPWVAPGARVDIRGDSLSVVALEPDGQGLVYLVCRTAV